MNKTPDNRIKLQTLDLGNPNITVELHKSLNKDLIVTPKLRTLLGIDPELVYSIFPPIFLRKSTHYYLIARYWVYSLYFIDSKERITINAAIIEDEKLIPHFHKYDYIDIDILKNIEPVLVDTTDDVIAVTLKASRKAQKPPGSRKTQSITQSIKKGRTCPYSKNNKHHALSTPRVKAQPDKDGFVHVRCVNRSKGCDFGGSVTLYELQLLKQRSYPTEKWFIEISGSICPKCKGHPLYLRTIFRDKKTIDKYHTCRNYYSLNNPCTFSERIGDD